MSGRVKNEQPTRPTQEAVELVARGGRATKSDSHNLHVVSPGDLVHWTAGNVRDAHDDWLDFASRTASLPSRSSLDLISPTASLHLVQPTTLPTTPELRRYVSDFE